MSAGLRCSLYAIHFTRGHSADCLHAGCFSPIALAASEAARRNWQGNERRGAIT